MIKIYNNEFSSQSEADEALINAKKDLKKYLDPKADGEVPPKIHEKVRQAVESGEALIFVDKTEAEEKAENAENSLTLDQAQNRKYSNDIKIEFYKFLLYGFMTSLGFKVDSTMEDSKNLSMVRDLALLKEDTEVVISDFDNKIQALSIADFEKILIELGNYINDAFAKKWGLRKQIFETTEKGQLDSINW